MVTKYFKKYSAMILLAVFVLALPWLVQAQTSGSDIPSLNDNLKNLGEAAQYDTNQNSIEDYPVIVGAVVKYFLYLVGVIYMGLMIYAGSIWMMAHGNEEAVMKSKAITRNATIGLILVVAAYAITYFVLAALGSGGFNRNLTGF